MESTFEKLAKRIKSDLDIEAVDFVRCYPGRHQRSGGAFVWCAREKNRSRIIGSQWSVTVLLKVKKIGYAERSNEIWPED